MTKDQEIGFVGIGNMGAPMVRNLARAGWSVVAFDQRPDVVTTLADEHPSITAALNIAEVAGCFNIITMLPTGADVRDVV
ncbi:MAG TPA: NAD(P)-binding domain-containing protein, partial [Afifellaceae bacterium]|nr:NAD(P)-binding domain-containing protein [Afifellaceae bacterium]